MIFPWCSWGWFCWVSAIFAWFCGLWVTSIPFALVAGGFFGKSKWNWSGGKVDDLPQFLRYAVLDLGLTLVLIVKGPSFAWFKAQKRGSRLGMLVFGSGAVLCEHVAQVCHCLPGANDYSWEQDGVLQGNRASRLVGGWLTSKSVTNLQNEDFKTKPFQNISKPKPPKKDPHQLHPSFSHPALSFSAGSRRDVCGRGRVSGFLCLGLPVICPKTGCFGFGPVEKDPTKP